MDLNLTYMSFFGDIIGFIIPLVIIFSIINALGGNKNQRTRTGGASSFGGTRLERMRGGMTDPNTQDVNRTAPTRVASDKTLDGRDVMERPQEIGMGKPYRTLDERDVISGPQLSSDVPKQDFGDENPEISLGNLIGGLFGTNRSQSSGRRSTYVPGRSEPLSTMKKLQEEQRSTSTIEREKRYAYDGQSSQSKSSTRDQIEREKRYSYDTQGYESKASNYGKAPEAALQKVSTGVAMSAAAQKRQESFIGGMGSEFLDSADQYLKMGDYHLTHKPGGLYSYSGSNYDLKTLNLKGVTPAASTTFREADRK